MHWQCVEVIRVRQVVSSLDALRLEGGVVAGGTDSLWMRGRKRIGHLWVRFVAV